MNKEVLELLISTFMQNPAFGTYIVALSAIAVAGLAVIAAIMALRAKSRRDEQ